MAEQIQLDPSEEYVILPVHVLEKILRYALTLCQDRCPVERDPEACYYLVKLCKMLGLPKPPCIEQDYEDFSECTFTRIVRQIEQKYKMSVREFVRRVKARGPRSLEESTDLMEAEFAMGMLRVISNTRNDILLVRGSQIRIVPS